MPATTEAPPNKRSRVRARRDGNADDKATCSSTTSAERTHENEGALVNGRPLTMAQIAAEVAQSHQCDFSLHEQINNGASTSAANELSPSLEDGESPEVKQRINGQNVSGAVVCSTNIPDQVTQIAGSVFSPADTIRAQPANAHSNGESNEQVKSTAKAKIETSSTERRPDTEAASDKQQVLSTDNSADNIAESATSAKLEVKPKEASSHTDRTDEDMNKANDVEVCINASESFTGRRVDKCSVVCSSTDRAHFSDA